ncbi:MAG: glutaredoxin 3 [Pseudomonadota bacterium]
MAVHVVIYTTPYCPYCIGAKRLLTAKNVVFEEIDVSRDFAQRRIMEEKSKRRTVPQIWIGEQHIGGFDDLNALNQQGELDALLKAAL